MKNELAFFTTELKRVETELVIYINAHNEIEKIEGIDDASKVFLNKSNNDMIKELTAQQTHIITQISSLDTSSLISMLCDVMQRYKSKPT